MKTIIEIMSWGDFNIQITDCIMVSDTKFDIKKLKENFCVDENISSFSGLPDNELDTYKEKFKLFLKELGFKNLKTDIIYFSD